MDETIAVSVIGGYLGAGKTTLVNHILRTATERIVVLVNDFGSINIDADLIESADGETISLTNGCICCSVTDGFAAALEDIRQLDPAPARIVIETSGVADPAAVAAYGHGQRLHLDAVVVVADVETVETRARDRYVGDTVTRQLAAADIVILNKTDLVAPRAIEQTRSWIQAHAESAVIINAVGAEVPAALLFDSVPASAYAKTADAGVDAGSIFETWSWRSDGSVEREVLERLMHELPDAVVRAKGIVAIADDTGAAAGSLVLQRVGTRWTIESREAQVDESRLVFIGAHGAIDDTWLCAFLQAD